MVDWICMALFEKPKAPDTVPGSIHSHTVILVVVVATAALGQTNGSMAAIQCLLPSYKPLPQTYSSQTHLHKARWVKCLAQGHNDHDESGKGSNR